MSGYIGQPVTVGQLRSMLACFSDDAPLWVRNGPRAVFRFMCCDGNGGVEVAIPPTQRERDEMQEMAQGEWTPPRMRQTGAEGSGRV